jgi:transcriptional regulator with XRE-family HTH domain
MSKDARLLSFALKQLRVARGWTQADLARAAGIQQTLISEYERGRSRSLSAKGLDDLLVVMGYGQEDLTATFLFHATICKTDGGTAGRSPVEPSPREIRRAGQLAALAALGEASHLRAELLSLARSRRAARARRTAGDLWQRLRRHAAAEQLELVEGLPEFQSWALAELLCDESVRAAVDSAEEARRLAALALRVAEVAPCDAAWRLRLRAYCTAFVANAQRVAGELLAAGASFATAWRLWRAAGATAPGPLPEWRLHDLEASLHRDQRAFQAAVACLDRARAGAPDAAMGRILLNRQFTLEQAGDFQGALAALEEAAPWLDASPDPGTAWRLEVNRLVILCHLGRYAEAEAGLPAAREGAVKLGGALDLARVLWLTGRVAAGHGQREEARAAFNQVRREFKERGMGYDTALASLELATLYLEDGRTAEVATLAEETMWIFGNLRVQREALAALRLFFQAARTGNATVDLARQAIEGLERAGGDPQPRRAAHEETPRAEHG